MSTACGTFAKMIGSSRLEMLRSESNDLAELFEQEFHLRDGDFLEFIRPGTKFNYWTKCRIISVDDCYINAAGGCTACVRVLPLLSGGKLGNTRSLTLATTDRGFRGVMVQVRATNRTHEN